MISISSTILLLLQLNSPYSVNALHSQHIRIGTRPSPLACEQVKSVAAALERANPFISTELVLLNSLSEHSGNPSIQDKPLGMSKVDFASVLDNALLDHTVDIVVYPD